MVKFLSKFTFHRYSYKGNFLEPLIAVLSDVIKIFILLIIQLFGDFYFFHYFLHNAYNIQ